MHQVVANEDNCKKHPPAELTHFDVAEHLECGPKARIIGDVQYNQIEIAVGAQVDGKLIPKSDGEIVEDDKKAGAEPSSGKTAPSDAV